MKTRCNGTTTQGKQCKKMVRAGKSFCALHIGQAGGFFKFIKSIKAWLVGVIIFIATLLGGWSAGLDIFERVFHSKQEPVLENMNNLKMKTNIVPIVFSIPSNDEQWNKEKAKNIIDVFSGTPTKEIIWFKWFRLSKNETYLSISYKTDAKTFSNDIFSVNRNMENIRVFHEVVNDIGSTKEAAIGKIDDVIHVFIYTISGSSAYLQGDLYIREKFGYLKKVHENINSYKDNDLTHALTHALTSSLVTEFNTKIIIQSGGISFSFRKNKEIYELYKYMPEFNYPDLGENVHILKINKVGKNITFNFDNKPILFKDEDKNEHILTLTALLKPKLRLGDEIVVLSNTMIYKTSYHGLNAKVGTFYSFLLNKKNKEEDYKGYFYYLNFNLIDIEYYIHFELNSKKPQNSLLNK